MKYLAKSKAFQGAFLCAAVLFGATACTDDHFDVQASVSGANTIWENIAAQENLFDFANILSQTVVMKDDNDDKSKITYKDLLDQPQSFTVWAPKNGTYNAKTYTDMLESIKSATDKAERLKLMYNLSTQFVGSHVARYNYESQHSRQKVTMLNSKRYYYDAGASDFNGVTVVVSDSDLHSSNGTVHLLNGISEYNYNLVDYIENDPRFSKMYEFYSSPQVQERTFSETSSTEGTLNENGEMVYVDSVYITTNEVESGTHASISHEDSLYLATYYTNDAWDEAVAALKPYFKYGSSYGYDYSTTINKFARDTTFNDQAKDSLADYNVKYLLQSTMFFNPKSFNVADPTNSSEIVNAALYADSLLSTNPGWIYYNKASYGKGAQAINPMFGSNTEPLKASNGYIFALDHFNTDIAYAWHCKNDVSSVICFLDGDDGMATSTSYNLDDSNINPAWNSDPSHPQGSFEDDMFMRFTRTTSGSNSAPSGTMNLYFRMPLLFSGAYKISIVTAPSTILAAYADNENYQDEDITFTARLYEDNRTASLDGNRNVTRVTVTADNSKVDTVVLFDKYEVAKCYYGLPDEVESYPILNITVGGRGGTSLRALNIGAIIYEPYREENE